MFPSLKQRIAYERTFGAAERWDLAKDTLARFVAWHCLPQRVCLWVIIHRHMEVTSGKFSNRHPDTVSAFDLYCTRAKS